MAHEFWVEPLDFILEPGDPVAAHLNVGEMMKGDTFPYLPDRFVEFSIRDPQEKRRVVQSLGTIPAAREQARRSGLHVFTYHSMPSVANYDAFESFEKFLEEEDLTGIAEAHRERGLPDAGFAEAFTRYAKALVRIGDGAGQDSPVGMPFELVAEANPYTQREADTLNVKLLWQGREMPDTQVKVFHRAEQGEVSVLHLVSDAEGRVPIALDDSGVYMLSAVHMIEASKEVASSTGAVWHSHWASLTFRAE